MAKELYTYLAKLISVTDGGYYSTMTVLDYTGTTFKAYRGNLSKQDHKAIKGNWNFIRLELQNGKWYYNNYALCSRVVAQQMIDEHREQIQAEKAAKEESN